MPAADRVTTVVMAGGRGERLWPLVRANRPKVCVAPDGKTSLLASTLARVEGLARQQDALLVITASQRAPIARAIPARYRAKILPEPQGKNTAACIGLAASVLAARDPEQVMVVLPADHWITPVAAFRKSLQAGIELAREHPRIVMVGMPATRVHTGLGHLCTTGAPTTRRGCATYRLQRFVEKPSPEVAEQLMREFRTFWNAGIFIGRVSTFLEAIGRHLPEHLNQLQPLGAHYGRPSFARRLKAAYAAVPSISFDHGVMNHLSDAFVVEGRFQWEDLGSWDSWVRMATAYEPVAAVDSPNARVVNFDRADGHLIALVGLADVIVVRTPDATLICRGDQAQTVRTIVAQLATDPRRRTYL
jgi:mannose-1-phosphate guanylyltransferase